MGVVSGNDVSGRAGCRVCNERIIIGQPAVYVVAGSYRTTYYIHSDPQDCSQERQQLERWVEDYGAESFSAEGGQTFGAEDFTWRKGSSIEDFPIITTITDGPWHRVEYHIGYLPPMGEQYFLFNRIQKTTRHATRRNDMGSYPTLQAAKDAAREYQNKFSAESFGGETQKFQKNGYIMAAAGFGLGYFLGKRW